MEKSHCISVIFIRWMPVPGFVTGAIGASVSGYSKTVLLSNSPVGRFGSSARLRLPSVIRALLYPPPAVEPVGEPSSPTESLVFWP